MRPGRHRLKTQLALQLGGATSVIPQTQIYGCLSQCWIHHCQTYGSSCYCSACEAGYRYVVDDCIKSSVRLPWAEAVSLVCMQDCKVKALATLKLHQTEYCISHSASNTLVLQPFLSQCVLENCNLYDGSTECACKQCRSGWEQSLSGACISLKSSSTGVIVGAAVGAAVAVAGGFGHGWWHAPCSFRAASRCLLGC